MGVSEAGASIQPSTHDFAFHSDLRAIEKEQRPALDNELVLFQTLPDGKRVAFKETFPIHGGFLRDAVNIMVERLLPP